MWASLHYMFGRLVFKDRSWRLPTSFSWTCGHWVGCVPCVIPWPQPAATGQGSGSALPQGCSDEGLLFLEGDTVVLLSSVGSTFGELIWFFIFWKTTVGWKTAARLLFCAVRPQAFCETREFVSCCNFQDWKCVGQEDNLLTFVTGVSDHGSGQHLYHTVGAIFKMPAGMLSFWGFDIHSCSSVGHGVCYHEWNTRHTSWKSVTGHSGY